MNYRFRPEVIVRTPSYHVEKEYDAEDPFFREALYLASPDLHDALYDGEEETNKVRISALKYFTRMKTRSTPFGLMAGCSVVNWGDSDSIELEDKGSFVRNSMLDMNYVGSLINYLASMPEVKKQLKYYPNTSIYKIFDNLRYVEYHSKSHFRRYSLSSVETNIYLEAIVKEAEKGATLESLATVITDEDISAAEAMDFMEQLVANQVLVHELEIAITETNNLTALIDKVSEFDIESKEIESTLDILRRIKLYLSQLDGQSQNTTESYKKIIAEIEQLNVEYKKKWVFQVDLFKPMKSGVLSQKYQRNLFKVLEILNRTQKNPKNDNLENFKSSFTARYQEQEVQLVEVLDNEFGIGYASNVSGRGEVNYLIDSIQLPGTASSMAISWNPWIKYLHQEVLKSKETGTGTIKLDAEKIKSIIGNPNDEDDNLPDTLIAPFSHLGEIDDRADKLIYYGFQGSSAANAAGRFAHLDERINEVVKGITKKEEELNADKIVAEIVHLPQTRTANILKHMPFRKYEIPYLSRPTVSKKYQISIQDLYVSVRNDKIIIRSKYHDKEVIPKLTNAHNFEYNSLPIYHFLCDLQTQDVKTGIVFSWQGLENVFNKLPRVECADVIVSLATWFFTHKDVEHLFALKGKDLQLAIKKFQEEHQLPRFLLFVDGDNEMFIDLENEESTVILLGLMKGESVTTLKEYLFDSKSSVVKDSKGYSYQNQFFAILEKNSKSNKPVLPLNEKVLENKVQRHFPIGSEWIYYKLYCGHKSADRILTESVPRLVNALKEEGLIDKWFFIRYVDTEHHLRIRFHIPDANLFNDAFDRVRNEVATLENEGLVWKAQMETYSREIERYGYEAMDYSEEVFYHDSEASLSIISLVSGGAGELFRWKYAIKSVDKIFEEFGFDLEQKQMIMGNLRSHFGDEFNMDKGLKRQLDKRFREERKTIEGILEGNGIDSKENEIINLVLKNRFERNRSTIGNIYSICQKYESGHAFNYLVMSQMHMAINRLFVSKQRFHEMVVYDFLHRIYTSQIARNNKVNN
jgi:thiopeptide-type bacteriocin biosynthesis protein